MTEAELIGALQELIATDELPVDGRMPPERDLAARFGVSRARLRQALDGLEDTGAIYRRQGSGTFAAPPVVSRSTALTRLASETTPQDVMEVRLEIEPALAALAASRARAEDLTRLERLMLATIAQSERSAYEAADDNFHYNIAVAARNPLFLEIFGSIRTVRKLATWSSLRRDTHTPEVMVRFGEQHRALFAAIRSRNSVEAARLMEVHLLDVNSTVPRRVKAPAPAQGPKS